MASDSQPKRILISRLSAIGDCVETMPVPVALKNAWPSCQITWIVDCAAEQLLRGHPAVDQVIRVKKGFLKKPSSVLGLRKQLQELRFDLAIDPQGLVKSGIICWMSRAKRRIGFDSSQAREGAWWFYTDRVKATKSHLVDKQLQLLEPLGIEHGAVNFGLNVSEVEQAWCRNYLDSIGVSLKSFMLINPGAGWASRRWPAVRFGLVALEAWRERRLPSIVVWSGEDELVMANEIARASASTIVAPSTSLKQLTALLAQSQFVLTSDTGPMHMAAALGVPCVALFGITNPAHCGPYGDGNVVIQKFIYREMTSRERRNCGNESMCMIQVEEVVEACLQQAEKTGERFGETLKASPKVA